MDFRLFFINEEPYCLWGEGLQQRCIEFLAGLDPGHFHFILETLLNAEDEARASVALRLALHHARETLFSLLAALVQAPNCMYAWVGRCSTEDLRDVVGKLLKGANLTVFVNADRISFYGIADIVFAAYLPGTDRQRETTKMFAEFWDRLARSFLEQNSIDEYNAMKHGFRVSPGGFTLAAGIETTPGVAAPPSAMKVIGQSKFGANFFKVEKIWPGKKTRSLKSTRVAINWSVEESIATLQLIAMSITNIVSAAKIINGTPAADCKFERPENDDGFSTDQYRLQGMTSMAMDFTVDERNAKNLSREDLLNLFKSWRGA